jgi:dipeptide/tripeptide permease
VQNLIANLAGIFGPVITGWLVDRTGSFAPAFALAAVACAVGVFAYAVLVPRIAPVRWPQSEVS